MKASLEGRVIAESDDVVECDGYRYFPVASVQRGVLEKSPKTDDDRACPHGVQFYDVVVDGKRHARNAWVYEAPRPKLQVTAGRVGFWRDVKLV